MPTITGFTKEKMDEIQGKTLASAHVSGTDLIFTNNDSDEEIIGDVGGLPGDPGPDGAITQADIDLEIDDLIPTDWEALPLETDWDPLGAPTTLAYRKIHDRVWFKGTASYQGTSVGNGVFVAITTALPVGFRPTYNHALGGCYDYQRWGDLRIYPDGILQVYLTTGRYMDSSSGDISLDSLSYPTS